MQRRHPALNLSLGLIFVLGIAFSAQAKEKPTAPCKAYFTILEIDVVTAGIPTLGLNKAQRDWYDKQGNRGEFAGICYWDRSGNESQAPLAKVISDEKSKKSNMPDAPVYLIAWGVLLEGPPDEASYQPGEQGSTTTIGQSGDSGSGTSTAAATNAHPRSKNPHVADGMVSRWDRATGKYVPVFPVHNHNMTVVTFPSTSLLKDAMKSIKSAEKLEK